MHKRPHERLIVWQRSYDLCRWLYLLTTQFPAHERFALSSQIRRAAFSVPANVAEGNARRSPKEKIYFFNVSVGSLEELHVALMLAHDLKYITADELKNSIRKLETASYLMMKLQASIKKKIIA